jgi:hypothetical protein
MLKNKNKNEVRCFITHNDNTLVGKVINETPDAFEVADLTRERGILNFVPVIKSADDVHVIYKSALLLSYKPTLDIVEAYNKRKN